MSQTKDQDEIAMLRSEIAYLRGKIEVYEKFLKDKGFIKEDNHDRQHQTRRNYSTAKENS